MKFSLSDTEHKSAFTVFNPRNGPNLGTLKFYHIVTNIGGHYNELTGQYHCSNPGTYVFSLHLYKEYGFDSAHCDIRKNATRLIHVLSDPDIKSDRGYYESSNTVTLHLSRGDIIDIGDCTTASTMAYWTSFSGYLLQTDP